MRLSEILAIDNIIPELKAKDKKGVLGELAEAIASYDTNIDKGVLVKVLIEREHLGSTGIGDGVAIPHGKLSSVNSPLCPLAGVKKGLILIQWTASRLISFFFFWPLKTPPVFTFRF
jgi:PTS system nitrogen regulatory IIA component